MGGTAVVAERPPEPAPSEPDSVPLTDGMAPLWPDETAEASFIAEARARGEPLVVARPAEESTDESAGKALPPLEELVQRIPDEVREVLEDLFRARFVAVRRLPGKALKE
ncbi:MAG: hypothetical protein Q8N18_02730 [Opitutaceae bacterium]|nr:hypothetical protein [Opitutaceae bacterium]